MRFEDNKKKKIKKYRGKSRKIRSGKNRKRKETKTGLKN